MLPAQDPEQAYERYAAQRPVAVVLAADFADGGAAALATRLRAADPRVLVVAVDKEHLGKARGLQAVLPLKANAYVANPTKRELVDKIQHLVSQSAGARAALRGAALVLSRAPSRAATLKPGALARALHQIWRALSEGILVLDEGGTERRIFFVRGVPAAFQSGDPLEGLVGWLAASGRLDEAQRTHALEAMASGLSPGAALIAAGVLEPGEPLQTALRAHLEAMVRRVIAAREGRWRFHPGAEFSSEVHAVEVLPLQLLLEGGRAGPPGEALRRRPQGRDGRPPGPDRGVPAAPPGVRALVAGPPARALPRGARDHARVARRAAEGLQGGAVAALVPVARVGGRLPRRAGGGGAVREGAARAGGSRSPPTAPTPCARWRSGSSPAPTSTRSASTSPRTSAEVERAYQEVASRFHPDTFAEYDVGELEDLLSAVQDKVTAAHRVLSSTEKRRAYLSFLILKLELTGARRPGIVMDAEIAMKRGERALLARRNSEAVQALRAAVDGNPKEPEYHAMLGFAELHDPVLPRAARAQEARRSARRALALEADHPRAIAVLALAEEAAGDVAEGRRVVLAGLKAHPANEVLRRVLHRLNRPRA